MCSAFIAVNTVHVPFVILVSVVVRIAAGIIVFSVCPSNQSIPFSVSTMIQIIPDSRIIVIRFLRSILLSSNVVVVGRVMVQLDRGFLIGLRGHSCQRSINERCMKIIIMNLSKCGLRGVIIRCHFQAIALADINALVSTHAVRLIFILNICRPGPNSDHVVTGILRSFSGQRVGKADSRNRTICLRGSKVPDKPVPAIHFLALGKVPATSSDILCVIGIIRSIADQRIIQRSVNIVCSFFKCILIQQDATHDIFLKREHPIISTGTIKSSVVV